MTITPHHLKLDEPLAMLPTTADKVNIVSLSDMKIAVHERWTKRKLVQQKISST